MDAVLSTSVLPCSMRIDRSNTYLDFVVGVVEEEEKHQKQESRRRDGLNSQDLMQVCFDCNHPTLLTNIVGVRVGDESNKPTF